MSLDSKKTGVSENIQEEHLQSPPISVLIYLLESVLNTASSLDSATADRLAPLEGKSLGLSCIDPEINAVIVLGKRSQVLTNVPIDDPMVSASLSGDRASWLSLLREKDKAAALINSNLQLRGDSQLFQQFATIVENIEIDWESLVASYIGDVPTHFGVTALRHSNNWISAQLEGLETSIENYLKSDDSPLISKQSCERLYQSLREFENKLDRIELRIKQLS